MEWTLLYDTPRWNSYNNSTNFLLLVCECNFIVKKTALQVRSKRSHVERQLPKGYTLSGIFLIGRGFHPSMSCLEKYLIRPGTTDCGQLSGNDPWTENTASWTRVFRIIDAGSNMVHVSSSAIWLDCDNIFLAIFERTGNTRSRTHFTSVKSGMWSNNLLCSYCNSAVKRMMSDRDENVEARSYRCVWLWGETD